MLCSGCNLQKGTGTIVALLAKLQRVGILAKQASIRSWVPLQIVPQRMPFHYLSTLSAQQQQQLSQSPEGLARRVTLLEERMTALARDYRRVADALPRPSW